MDKNNFFSNRKASIIFTLIVMILGSVYYFAFLNQGTGMGSGENLVGLYLSIKLKAAYTEDGKLKIFALAKNNELSKLAISEGQPIPESDSVVLGYTEAKMMREEGKLNNISDKLDNLFGINTEVGGILKKTDTIIDDFHFLSESQFNQLNGEEGRIFIRLSDGKDPEMIYTYSIKEVMPLEFKLVEGDMQNYKNYFLAGEDYYPLILGYDDAQEMREQKEFEKMGDIIKDFLGKKIVVVGIIEKTNTGLDMMHITTLSEKDLPKNDPLSRK